MLLHKRADFIFLLRSISLNLLKMQWSGKFELGVPTLLGASVGENMLHLRLAEVVGVELCHTIVPLFFRHSLTNRITGNCDY